MINSPNWAERSAVLLDLVSGFIDKKWTVAAAVPGGGPLDAELARRGVAVRAIPCGPFSSRRKTFGDVFRFLRQISQQRSALVSAVKNADLLYVNGPRLLPAVALTRPRCPIVFHCHSLITQRSAAKLAGWALRSLPPWVIASSRFVAEPMAGFVPDAAPG